MATGIIKVNNTVDQTAGKSIELKYTGTVGYSNDTNQPCMFCPFPFEAKNTNYSVSVSSFNIDGVGNPTNPNAFVKYKNGVCIKGTLTVAYNKVFGTSAIITVTFA
jgi:hypothetical protein